MVPVFSLYDYKMFSILLNCLKLIKPVWERIVNEVGMDGMHVYRKEQRLHCTYNGIPEASIALWMGSLQGFYGDILNGRKPILGNIKLKMNCG